MVAKYKDAEYRCEVIEDNGALCFVLADGRTFKSPSAAGRAITVSEVNGNRFWSVSGGPRDSWGFARPCSSLPRSFLHGSAEHLLPKCLGPNALLVSVAADQNRTTYVL